MPKMLWRIEQDNVCQYEFFSMTQDSRFAIYFHWGTTIPIVVNVHDYHIEFHLTAIQAYKDLRYALQRQWDSVQSIIDDLTEEDALKTSKLEE